ncbi:MAG: dipeptide ABC transporter permease DppC, partial [Alphaproteobacteria bacterium]|nr:dipeptide ABC transporter permease DppC [Alphaproteobacteria bacterium]
MTAETGQASKPEAADAAPIGVVREFWYYFSENRGAVVGLAVIVIVLLSALFADIVAPHSPTQQYRDHFLAPPFWAEEGSTQFLLGTDAVGRDILSRIIHGARYSLFIALIVVSLSLTFGVSIGLVAGFARGWTEAMIMRAMDILLAVPSLLLAIVIVAILGPGLFNAVIAIA